jgi:hypothetical protein
MSVFLLMIETEDDALLAHTERVSNKTSPACPPSMLP